MLTLIRQLMILSEVQVITAQKLNHENFQEVNARIEEIKGLIIEQIKDSVDESSERKLPF